MNNLRNKVQLIGKLGINPEVRALKDGKKLARLSIATKDVYKNMKGEKVVETQWHNLIAWGKVAENMEVFLKKGNEVAVQGKLQHRSYENKEGIKKYITEIVVMEFMLLSKAPSAAAADEAVVNEPQVAGY